MTKYAAEDVIDVVVRGKDPFGDLVLISPVQRAAVAVALERPEEVLRDDQQRQLWQKIRQ